jgi:hypothetical protein
MKKITENISHDFRKDLSFKGPNAISLVDFAFVAMA